MTTRTTIVLSLTALLIAAAGARAQRHEDSRHGISFSPPKDFVSVALQPTEFLTIVKYQAEQTDYGGTGDYAGRYSLNRIFRIEYWPPDLGMNALIDDDQAEKKKEAEPEPDDEFNRFDKKLEQELAEMDPIEAGWKRIEARFGLHEVVKSKKIKINKRACEERHIRRLDADGNPEPVMYWVALVGEDDAVFAFIGNAFENKFDKAAGEYASVAKSLKRIEKDGSLTSLASALTSQMGDQEKFLQEQIDRLPPGWDHLRTDRYLFLFNADKNFVKEMAERIEAMRDVYAEMWPPDKPINAVSIVRVCNSEDEYQAYGGPGGSGGYWNWVAKELVFFDMRPRSQTMAVLNHEAFHQYIYYACGNIAPHSWFNEGHGDFFAGADMTKSHRIRGFGDAPGGFSRLGSVKEACRLRRSGKSPLEGWAATPLVDLLRYTQQEYYNRSGVHYPQGWAFIHMLRQGKGLKPEWKTMLDRYLQHLLDAREEVAREVMEAALKAAEENEKGSSDGMSREPSDYYGQVNGDGQLVEKVRLLAYERTFEGWSDLDWKEFDDFYLDYVEKL